jgi:predicted porin
MKKSLLALAALTAFTGAVSAQSNVTLYGRVDLAINESLGRDGQAMYNGSGSRLGLRGSEDLGGGLAAVFNLEHRFNADTGVSGGDPRADVTAAARFWHGRSIVGLKGGFGQVVLGREYTTAFLGSQLINDPWGYDTVVSDVSGAINSGGIGKVRNDSSITYNLSMAGFNFGAQYAEATDAITNVANNPMNMSVGYAGGPFSANFGWEVTGEETGGNKGEVFSLGGGFNFGAFKIGGSYVWGTVGNSTTRTANGPSATTGALITAGSDVKAFSITGTMVLGQGELRAMWGEREFSNVGGKSVKDISAFGVGYHYALSKRTTIYTDYVMNTKRDNFDSGYDFGIKHNF